MAIIPFIRERGFRKWYERELLHSHVHLVLLLLCAIALLGAIEAFAEQHGAQRLMLAAAFVIAGAIGVWALRRYLFHLMRAERVANQAVCAHCHVYARWVVESGAHGDAAAGRADTAGSIAVRCRACGHGWTIDC